MSGASLPVIDDCWNRIGVRGDRSCPKLPEHIHCHNCEVFASAAQTLLDRPALSDYTAELTQFVAEPAASRRLPDQSVVLFAVAREGFAVPTACVVEMTDVERPRPVPHRVNAVFRGLVKIRGQLELCISLRGLLGIAAPDAAAIATSQAPAGAADRATERLPVLVVAFEGERWAWLVDSVSGVHRYESGSVLESPSASHKTPSFVSGLIPRADGQHYGLLDVARVREQSLESLR
jgi:chemotaxis-related protein WspD